MNWAVLIPIIAQYGLPLAESLFQKWQTGAVPTLIDFDQLRAMASQTAQDRTRAMIVAAGMSLDDPKAVALLALSGIQ